MTQIATNASGPELRARQIETNDRIRDRSLEGAAAALDDAGLTAHASLIRRGSAVATPLAVLCSAARELRAQLTERAGEPPVTYAPLRTALNAVGHAMAWQVPA